MTMPIDNNISVKEYNKIIKYKELEIEMEKCNTINKPQACNSGSAE